MKDIKAQIQQKEDFIGLFFMQKARQLKSRCLAFKHQ